MGQSPDAQRICSGSDAQLVFIDTVNAPEIAKRIGEAAAKALTSVGRAA